MSIRRILNDYRRRRGDVMSLTMRITNLELAMDALLTHLDELERSPPIGQPAATLEALRNEIAERELAFRVSGPKRK